MKKRFLLVAIALLSACSTMGEGEEGSPSSPEFLLHSDLPLWIDYEDQSLSPRHFSDEDSFGCVSEFPFGDWQLTYLRGAESYVPDPVWWQVLNYGVFHCGALFSSSATRGGGGETRPGFAVNLGIDQRTGLELWAWQIGMRPGSEYILLARPKDSDTDKFLVLNPDCEAGEERRTDPLLSVWRTAYCNVPSQKAMLAIAGGAAAKPAIGSLAFAGKAATSKQ